MFINFLYTKLKYLWADIVSMTVAIKCKNVLMAIQLYSVLCAALLQANCFVLTTTMSESDRRTLTTATSGMFVTSNSETVNESRLTTACDVTRQFVP